MQVTTIERESVEQDPATRLAYIVGERNELRRENTRLIAELEGLRVASRPRPRKAGVKVNGRTAREAALLAEGKPPFKGALWFGPEHGWGIKRSPAVTIPGRFAVGMALPLGNSLDERTKAAYLAATGKTSVPAHDPAFGRR